MRFTDILNQGSAIERIRGTLATGRVPHAWLFHGPRGSGKTLAALAMARSLQCAAPGPAGACESCPACRQSAHFNHPDIHILPPTPSFPDTQAGEGQRTEFIGEALVDCMKEPIFRIDESRPLEHRIRSMRWLKQEAGKSMVMGPYKIFILKTAGLMNVESANALLKVLEEPALGTILILGVERPAQLPATIPSRCALVRFLPLPAPVIARELMTRLGAEEKEAAIAARMAEGSLTAAARFIDEALLPLRDEAIELLRAGRGDPERHGLIDGWLKNRERVRLALLFDLLTLWYRDLLRVRCGAVDAEEGLANVDRRADIERDAAGLTPADILESIRLVEEARRSADGYGYAPLVLYSLLERLPRGSTGVPT